MNKTNLTVLPPEESLADLAHFAWCALVGLRLAQQDGQARSPLTIHTFLVRWLADVQKQRRFPRSVAPDIDSLLRLGRMKGPAANLLQRLEYLLDACSNPVSQQSDLFRLTHAIEHLKSQGWVNAVVADEEWLPESLCAEYTGVSALLVRRSELQQNFTNHGQQSAPIEFIVVGNAKVVSRAMEDRALYSVVTKTHPSGCVMELLSSEGSAVGNSGSGKAWQAE